MNCYKDFQTTEKRLQTKKPDTFNKLINIFLGISILSGLYVFYSLLTLIYN